MLDPTPRSRKQLTRVVHIQITPEHTPQDPFERGHPAAFDRTGDKLQVEPGKTSLARHISILGGMLEQWRVVAFVERGSNLGMSVLGLPISATHRVH